MYITFKEVAYVIPFEDGQIITDNGTKASEFDYVGRSGEKKILWQENDEVKKAPARVEKFVKESLEKEEDEPADESIMGESADAASVISDSIFIRISEN